jgi:hypothetical protein
VTCIPEIVLPAALLPGSKVGLYVL